MNQDTCSAPSCDRPAKTKGYCPAHYLRTLKGKSLDAPLRPRGRGFDVCQVKGCDKAFFGRGMCSMHYNRLRNYGSQDYQPAPRVVTDLPPLTCVSPGCAAETRKRALCDSHAKAWDAAHPRNRADSLEARLEAQTMKTGGCWYWVGGLSHDYYGFFGSKPLGTSRAHRTVWTMANGPIPEGMQVDHICHVTFCIKPDHLRLAEPAWNSAHRQGANRGNKSGYRGVTWYPAVKMWRGRVMHQGVNYEVGNFEDPYDAHLAVVEKRRELHHWDAPDNKAA